MISSLSCGATESEQASRRPLGGEHILHTKTSRNKRPRTREAQTTHAQAADNAAKPQTTREAQLSRQLHHFRLHLRAELRFDLVDPTVEELVEDFVDDGGVVVGAGSNDVVEEL